ncbi:RNA polymerase sigma factor [Pyxidicoccus sp. MSG2]|uniref:RNA polymerase sigma factor n=1 Tax=Pyxidicoccus sp. MSG2 TaxID=2996790 RepID=UPI00226FFAC1|nr:sigma-70 family RNA polymerase sigma factor [Pyxidicoccus sp. MSG2]MCY1022124.1 sigma-70 family RNA polymerase sigma factor [Pyxidicoccus sp. MSG2]
MSFPSQSEEEALHERLLSGDPVASSDVMKAFMDPILAMLGGSRLTGLQRDEVYDSIIDVLFAYTEDPKRFIPGKGRLRSYLTEAARKRLADRRRSRESRERREQKFGVAVELGARSPKEVMETSVEARETMERLEKKSLSQRDLTLLRLYLEGEGSTRAVGEALGLPPMPEAELRQAVKRHWDRFKKTLARTGEEWADVDP